MRTKYAKSRDKSIHYFQYGGVCLHSMKACFNIVFGKSNFKGSVSWTAHVRAEAQKLEKFCRIFQDWPGQKNMVAASGLGGHGGRRRNSGRKKSIPDLKQYKRDWFKNRQRIFLKNNIFRSWLSAKYEAGYECASDSDFAAHLLCLEYRRR